MSDIYIPGVKSRFGSEKIVEDLMKVERIPRDRAQQQIESYKSEKGYWQDLGRRITTLRESARSLYSFQNPFSDRTARSSNETVLSATATRQAVEQEKSFIVKRTAKADRFLSNPLETSFKVDAGTYTFKVGNNEISFDYRGGTLKDFTEVLNRRGKGTIRASVMAVEKGTQSLLLESLVTGAENRLSFSGAAESLARRVGITEQSPEEKSLPEKADVFTGGLTVTAGGAKTISFSEDAQELSAHKGMVLHFESSTKVTPPGLDEPETPPSGPEIPGAGSVSFGGITIENDPSSVPLPEWEPPAAPIRVDDMGIISLVFTDGTKAALPLVKDSEGFISTGINLDEITAGRTIASMEIVNNNTHRDFSIRNVAIINTAPRPDTKPANALSTAQDAVLVMDGIEIKRPSNEIDDLIPGVKILAKAPSPEEVTVSIEPDREAAKEAIITMVGNYNRLIGELNVLTRNDERVIHELTYFTPEERAEMRKRLGVFSGDSIINQFRNNLLQTVTGSYLTQAGPELSMLAQIGIGTDVRRAGATTGYDPARLRGYLEIDEKVLDAALQGDLRPIQQLFGYDTDGDLIVDSGVSFNMENLLKPYVEIGGIISLKTGTIDSKIKQEERSIATLDRQLEAKEASLRRQYGLMEDAYERMEKMGTSLENFSRQANSINGSRR
ncbi:MAG: flagellar filament capping protein FliD [Spirochaetaceae bacterium]|jgi:flagellar hook-associated protein 2|nr:flagellar filament capping protein FliD [Spirochaetaceae bacterium]